MADLHLSKSTKLSLLYQVRGTYKLPKYINFMKNPLLRKALTSWRLSCHSLAIERGRYLGIARQDRLCTKCNLGEVGDEIHVLFICSDNVLNKIFKTQIYEYNYFFFQSILSSL